jgi:hypothetical protein
MGNTSPILSGQYMTPQLLERVRQENFDILILISCYHYWLFTSCPDMAYL